MSHPNSPEYFTISSVCPHDGTTTTIGIFEDMDAVTYRLKRMYTTCGDEYRVECFHLSTASNEAEEYNEQIVSRRKYQKESEIKDKLYQAFKKKENEDDEDLALLAYETKVSS